MVQKLIFKDVDFSIEEETEIVLIKEFNVESHIKGYHAYMKKWEPKKDKTLTTRLEPENANDKFAVAVEKNDKCLEI